VRWLRSFAAFMWDFIVGDDWLLAAGVVAAFGLTAALVAAGVPGYWCAPVVLVGVLTWSVRRATRAG
jgi:hypothetical protein